MAKSWERPWSVEEIVDNAPKWTLAGDVALLKTLEDFSEKLFTKAEAAYGNVNNLLDDLNESSIKLDLVKNEFLGLQNTQFIESRVYEDDETLEITNDEKTEKKESDVETKDAIKHAVLEGLQILDKYYEKVTVPASDSEDDEVESNCVLRMKDPYINRPLPYLIGTKEWYDKWHVGLVASSSEDEEEEVEEKYSDTDSESNLPVTDRRGVSTSDSGTDLSSRVEKPVANSTFNDTLASTDSEEFNNSIPSKPPISNLSFAEQLAARLSNVDANKEQEPVPVNKNPIQKSIVPTRIIGDILSDEPPPLDNSEDGLFGTKSNQGMFSGGDGLFNDSDDDTDYFGARKVLPTTKSKPTKSSENKVPNLFDDKEEEGMFAQKVAGGNKSDKPKATSRGLFSDEESDDDDLFSSTSNQQQHVRPSYMKSTSNAIPFIPDEPPELTPKIKQKLEKESASRNLHSAQSNTSDYTEKSSTSGDLEADNNLLINTKQKPKKAYSFDETKNDKSKSDNLFSSNSINPKDNLFDEADEPSRKYGFLDNVRISKNDQLFDDSDDGNVKKSKSKSHNLFDDPQQQAETDNLGGLFSGKPKKVGLFDDPGDLFNDDLFSDAIFSTSHVRKEVKEKKKLKLFDDEDDDIFVGSDQRNSITGENGSKSVGSDQSNGSDQRNSITGENGSKNVGSDQRNSITGGNGSKSIENVFANIEGKSRRNNENAEDKWQRKNENIEDKKLKKNENIEDKSRKTNENIEDTSQRKNKNIEDKSQRNNENMFGNVEDKREKKSENLFENAKDKSGSKLFGSDEDLFQSNNLFNSTVKEGKKNTEGALFAPKTNLFDSPDEDLFSEKNSSLFFDSPKSKSNLFDSPVKSNLFDSPFKNDLFGDDKQNESSKSSEREKGVKAKKSDSQVFKNQVEAKQSDGQIFKDEVKPKPSDGQEFKDKVRAKQKMENEFEDEGLVKQNSDLQSGNSKNVNRDLVSSKKSEDDEKIVASEKSAGVRANRGIFEDDDDGWDKPPPLETTKKSSSKDLFDDDSSDDDLFASKPPMKQSLERRYEEKQSQRENADDARMKARINDASLGKEKINDSILGKERSEKNLVIESNAEDTKTITDKTVKENESSVNVAGAISNETVGRTSSEKMHETSNKIPKMDTKVNETPEISNTIPKMETKVNETPEISKTIPTMKNETPDILKTNETSEINQAKEVANITTTKAQRLDKPAVPKRSVAAETIESAKTKQTRGLDQLENTTVRSGAGTGTGEVKTATKKTLETISKPAVPNKKPSLVDLKKETPVFSLINDTPPDIDWDQKSETNLSDDEDMFDDVPVSSQRALIFDKEPPALDFDKSKSSVFDDKSKSLISESSIFDDKSKSSLFDEDDIPSASRVMSLFDDEPPSLDFLVKSPQRNNVGEKKRDGEGKKVSIFDDDTRNNRIFDKELKNSIVDEESKKFSAKSGDQVDFKRKDVIVDIRKNEGGSSFGEDEGLVKSKPSNKMDPKRMDFLTKSEGAKSPEEVPKKKDSPGKLKHNLNINVNALMPGASLPRKKDNSPSSTLSKSKSLEDGQESEKDETPERIPHAQSCKDVRTTQEVNKDRDVETLQSITKNRARIQTKRKPSTRRARQASIKRRNEEDNNNFTDDINSSTDTNPDDNSTISSENNNPDDSESTSKINNNTDPENPNYNEIQETNFKQNNNNNASELKATENINKVSLLENIEKEKLDANKAFQSDKQKLDVNKAFQSEKQTLDANKAFQSEKQTLDANKAFQSEKQTLDANKAFQSEKQTLDANKVFQSDKQKLDANKAFQSEKENSVSKQNNNKAKEQQIIERSVIPKQNTSSSLFDELSDDSDSDIFSSSKKHKSKTNLFEDDKQESLVKEKNVEDTRKLNLFKEENKAGLFEDNKQNSVKEKNQVSGDHKHSILVEEKSIGDLLKDDKQPVLVKNDSKDSLFEDNKQPVLANEKSEVRLFEDSNQPVLVKENSKSSLFEDNKQLVLGKEKSEVTSFEDSKQPVLLGENRQPVLVEERSKGGLFKDDKQRALNKEKSKNDLFADDKKQDFIKEKSKVSLFDDVDDDEDDLFAGKDARRSKKGISSEGALFKDDVDIFAPKSVKITAGAKKKSSLFDDVSEDEDIFGSRSSQRNTAKSINNSGEKRQARNKHLVKKSEERTVVSDPLDALSNNFND